MHSTENKRWSSKFSWLLGLMALLLYVILQPNLSQIGDREIESPSATEGLISSQRDSQNPSDSTTADEFQLGYNFLTELGPQEFVSPAGLRYTRGSEQGHRLKHLARHLADQPERPGRHGVFEADMQQVLLWLDEAYHRSKAKEIGTSVRHEGQRTIMEASFEQPIGYVGGRVGRRLKNPKTKKLRLVIDGDRVITAFPF